MLLNTVHRGRWEYIARSIIDIIIIFFVVVNIIIGRYSECFHSGVITMHFWQEWRLITATQLCWQYDSSRCMMGDVVQEQFLFSRQCTQSLCPRWTHCSIYMDHFQTCPLCVLSKAEMSLQDVKVVEEDWLKSLFYFSFSSWKCSLLYFLFVGLFLKRRINKYIVKSKLQGKKTQSKQTKQVPLKQNMRVQTCRFPT